MLSEAVAALEREVLELRDMVSVLKGALAARGLSDIDAVQVEALTDQQNALVGVLYYARPGAWLHAHQILDLLPGRDHITERNPKQVGVVVSRIRDKLGLSSIESGKKGYRLSEAFRASLTS